MVKKGLTEHEQRMASAWLDQELPESERDYIEARLVDGDEELRSEIEGYRQVRSEFRGWFQREVEPAGRCVDLWRAIEKEITRKKGFDWSALQEKYLGPLLRPYAVGGMLAAAAVALLVFTPVLNQGQRSTQLAENEALEISRLQNGGPGSPALVVARQGADTLGRLPVPDVLAVRLLSSPQLIVNSQNAGGQVAGGFRTGGTDIEWIKTEKPFKLVATRQRQAPPVIWVAQSRK